MSPIDFIAAMCTSGNDNRTKIRRKLPNLGNHWEKSVRIRSFSGPYFPVFGQFLRSEYQLDKKFTINL